MNNPIILLKEKVNTPIMTEESVGKIKRETTRKRNKNKLIKKGLILFEKHFPQIFLPEPELTSFNEKWPIFVKALCAYLSSQNDVVIAHNAIAKAIDEGNKAQLWEVAISTHLIQIKRERPFKSSTWFKHVKILHHFEKTWLNDIYSLNNIDEQDLLINCLISAVCHSGLNEVHHIEALLNTLQDKKPLKLKQHLIYLDLMLNPADFKQKFPFSTNYYPDKTEDAVPVLINRFFPSSITLGFINHYLKKRKNKQKLTTSLAWKIIIKQVKQLTGEEISKRNFCQAGIGISETKPNVNLPEALVEYTTKRNMSYSLPPKNWQTIGCTYQTQQVEKFPTPATSNITTSRHQKSSHKKCSFGLIDDLKKAVKEKNKDRVRSPNTALKAVNQCFDLSDPTKPLHEKILVSWMVMLLEKKKTTSTLTRYFSAIGALWISYTSAIDVNNTPESFDALYTGMLELTCSNKDHDYKAKLLIRVHNFAVRLFGLPPVIDFSFSTNRSIPHVRASFVPESAFASLIQSIALCEYLNSTEHELLTIIFILAYRTGMRLGEILKLKVSDIEWSAQCWIFIRDNEYDHNKSNASRRKIPLICLLTPNELDLFKEFIKNAAIPQKRKKMASTLLFSTTLNSNVSLKKSPISLLFNQLITKITELDLFVFHSFRHTTLSRLQLIIHYQEFKLNKNLESLKTELLPYSDQQISKISMAISGHSTRGKYWSLCSFSGHRSPQITFNSYLHFCDLLTHFSLDMNQQLFTTEQIWHITKLSRNELNTLCSKNNTGTIKINQIMPLLLQKISNMPYCHVITLPEIKQPKSINDSLPAKKDHSKKFMIVYDILHSIELGENIDLYMWSYNINQDQINKWQQKAEIINKITTHKNCSKNISNNRKQGLIATLPKNPADVEEMTKLVDFLRNKLKNIQKTEREMLFLKICEIVLCGTNMSCSAIVFRDHEHLKDFLVFFSFFPKNRWFIRINCSDKKILTRWKKALRDAKNISGVQVNIKTNFTHDARNPIGNVELYLLSHSSEVVSKKNNWQKYSTNIIKFTINIIAIIWLDEEQLEQLIELA